VAAHGFVRGSPLDFFSITTTPQRARKVEVPSKLIDYSGEADEILLRGGRRKVRVAKEVAWENISVGSMPTTRALSRPARTSWPFRFRPGRPQVPAFPSITGAGK
jgi:hypothetical protein